MTVATDVQGYYSEKELKRIPKDYYFHNYYYYKIIKEGEFKIINFKNETIDPEITCGLGGFVTSAVQKGKITLSDYQQKD